MQVMLHEHYNLTFFKFFLQKIRILEFGVYYILESGFLVRWIH